jgi:acetyl esterase/lipase
VFFFGGGWRDGSVEQFRPQAEYLAGRGLVAARADYRVLNRHGTTADRAVEDAKSALRWLRQHAGALGIDPHRLVGAGGSAGAHLAACADSVPGFEAEGEDLAISSKPNLLVLFNPVLDATVDSIRTRLPVPADPATISPLRHAGASACPSILFYGDADPLAEQGRRYVARARELRVEANLHLASGVGHGFFNKEPWRGATLGLVDAFLARHGCTSGPSTLPLSREADIQPPISSMTG